MAAISSLSAEIARIDSMLMKFPGHLFALSIESGTAMILV
jgi:hypothetical protein